MKTMILAAATVLSLSAGVALANESGGYGGPTQFTAIPGVLAQAPLPVEKPASAVAQNQNGQVHVFATQSKADASPFQPGYNNG